jgi:hypothetical protein
VKARAIQALNYLRCQRTATHCLTLELGLRWDGIFGPFTVPSLLHLCKFGVEWGFSRASPRSFKTDVIDQPSGKSG